MNILPSAAFAAEGETTDAVLASVEIFEGEIKDPEVEAVKESQEDESEVLPEDEAPETLLQRAEEVDEGEAGGYAVPLCGLFQRGDEGTGL